MKPINLISITNAYRNLKDNIFQRYLEHFGVNSTIDNTPSGIKEAELEDLKSFCEKLNTCKPKNTSVFDCFFLGYSIPQIGKEFDLLRFGQNYLINIELKHKSTKEKIKRQLTRNKYYLSFLAKNVFFFTYVVNEEKLYSLGEDGDIAEVDMTELYSKLSEQKIEDINDIDNLFDPTNYLVSPFNSTKKFMEENYFLTNQQEEIKSKVLALIGNAGSIFISVTGTAGTGKTLLVYDIAKEMKNRDSKVLILHCARLNDGQIMLNEDWNWTICQTKDGLQVDFSQYDLVIVDEAQRIKSAQFETIVEKIKKTQRRCIFSYDQNQCLHRSEIIANISQKIETIALDSSFKLTDKIRTNKEISSFIRRLLDNKRNERDQQYSNIKLCYCSKRSEAKRFLRHLHDHGWKVPQYTPGTITAFQYEEYQVVGEDSAHAIIGQEYDNVVAVIDECFCYNSEGRLSIKGHGGYYSQRQMLFQILTRTRKKLYIVIINNEDMLKRCLDILHPHAK